jgi:TIR domain
MSGKIFINYRRADSGAWAQTLRNKLVAHFGEQAVFHDLTGVPLGARLRPFIAAHVADCVAMIPVIGPQWLKILRERSGLDSPDHVFIEIEVALTYSKRIIPIMVEGAAMPTEADLPQSIRGLADCAGMALTPQHINAELEGLVAHLGRIFETAKAENRLADSHVEVTTGGMPKLVAKGNVFSKPSVVVNQGPLRAAHAADMAAQKQADTSRRQRLTQVSEIPPAANKPDEP